MYSASAFGALVATFASTAFSQSPTVSVPRPEFATPQPNTWASPSGSSSHNHYADVIAAAGFDNYTSQTVQVAMDFEASNWATGSVFEDEFYQLPPNASNALPGQILKVQDSVNASLFSFPPELAISRFVYQTSDFNGTAVPTSGYILWPFAPRQFPNMSCESAPMVVWAHGTSGVNAECAPSHYQDLWYEYVAPITLALQGYAVVATDFAGLGINKTADGKTITHQWGANLGLANSVLDSVTAAREAFPTELSEQFVMIGHSEGGGAVWGASQKLVDNPMDGYLGVVAASPANNFFQDFHVNASIAGPTGTLLALTATSIFPDFKLSDWLTAAGESALKLYTDLSGCWAVRTQIVNSLQAFYIRDDWLQSGVFARLANLLATGGKPFAGPMLVVQGTQDKLVNYYGTNTGVNQTCENVPNADIEYVVFDGPDHIPTMYASQPTWLGWIADRFAGQPTQGGCTNRTVEPFRKSSQYQKEINYYIELPLYQYEKGI
ncbi:MAG: hypothetical protein Q9162_003013 [Coniocarpon cinnabarinum]